MKKAYMDGYICGTPKESATSNGYVVSFGFNSPDNRRNPDGTWSAKPQFFDFKYFYKDADDAAARAIMAKEGRFMIAATPHYDEWEKDGQKRSKTVFTVDAITQFIRIGELLKPDDADDDIPF